MELFIWGKGVELFIIMRKAAITYTVESTHELTNNIEKLNNLYIGTSACSVLWYIRSYIWFTLSVTLIRQLYTVFDKQSQHTSA